MPSRTLNDARPKHQVAAAPDACFRVAADFERYPEWAGSVQYVKVSQ